MGILIPQYNAAILFRILLCEAIEMMNSSCHLQAQMTLREEVACELGRPIAELLDVSSDFELYSTKNVCIHDLILAFIYVLRTIDVCMFI